MPKNTFLLAQNLRRAKSHLKSSTKGAALTEYLVLVLGIGVVVLNFVFSYADDVGQSFDASNAEIQSQMENNNLSQNEGGPGFETSTETGSTPPSCITYTPGDDNQTSTPGIDCYYLLTGSDTFDARTHPNGLSAESQAGPNPIDTIYGSNYPDTYTLREAAFVLEPLGSTSVSSADPDRYTLSGTGAYDLFAEHTQITGASLEELTLSEIDSTQSNISCAAGGKLTFNGDIPVEADINGQNCARFWVDFFGGWGDGSIPSGPMKITHDSGTTPSETYIRSYQNTIDLTANISAQVSPSIRYFADLLAPKGTVDFTLDFSQPSDVSIVMNRGWDWSSGELLDFNVDFVNSEGVLNLQYTGALDTSSYVDFGPQPGGIFKWLQPETGTGYPTWENTANVREIWILEGSEVGNVTVNFPSASSQTYSFSSGGGAYTITGATDLDITTPGFTGKFDLTGWGVTTLRIGS